MAVVPEEDKLLAAMNPWPCGHLGDDSGRCHCPPDVIGRYRQRISGPLRDRIDLHVEVPAMRARELRLASRGEPSDAVRARVVKARLVHVQREGVVNAALSHGELERTCRLQGPDAEFLEQVSERLGLSARAYHRILKVARTIADLAGTEDIERSHLGEAVSYRVLDRQ